MTDGLKAKHRAAIIATLAANDRVERAVLFGARAVGTNTITSDVDIALFGQQLTLTDQASLAAACEELPMAQSVDLVLHSTIDNPAMVEHIRSHGVEWYRRGGGGWKEMPFNKAFLVNPSTRLNRDVISPYVEMSSLNPRYRSVRAVKERTFRGSGSRFIDGDTLMARITPCLENGKTARYCAKDKTVVAHGSTEFIVIRGRPGISDSSFAFYMTCSATVRNFAISQMTGTSGRQRVPAESLAHLTVRIPPLPEQKAIAHILGTLDDKIELNRRMNETLEAMARALFKDWFVDFGPVQAKAEGREAYLPEEIWGLFPDSFEGSELGEIPRGWGVKPLSEVASFLNGLALQKYPATSPEDSLPVIKIAELRNGISAKTDKASRNIPKKYIVTDGDFLFAWSGSLMAQFWTEGEGALNQHLFKVTSDQYPPWFFAGWVRFHLDGFQRIAASKATTMGHIQRSHLQAALASCPPDDTLIGLGALVESLVRRGVSASMESRSLAKVRDLLLPKLMSGEIRVREGEKVMEVAS